MIGRIGQYYSLMAVAICTNKNTQKISCRQLKKKERKKKTKIKEFVVKTAETNKKPEQSIS